MEGVDLAAVDRLASLADVNRLLHETFLRERLIEGQLEGLQLNRAARESRLVQLRADTAELLDLATADAEGLAASVRETSQLSERVIKKVRELDTAQGCAQRTLARVSALVLRSKARNGVQEAMAAADYQAAARHIEEYSQLERQADGEDGQATAQLLEQDQVIVDAKKQLLETFRGQLAAAQEEEKHAEVLRLIKLLCALDAKREGMERLTAHLRNLIKARAEQDYSNLVETTGAEPDFIGALTGLLRDVGHAYHEHEAFVAATFGPEPALVLLDGLQAECDAHGARVLRRYSTHRRLERTAHDIRATRTLAADAAAAPPLDPRQLEGVLEEMLAICQRAEEYCQFMLAKAAAAAAPAPLPSAHENALRAGAFNTAVRELTSYYINMEEFYIERCVEKGVQIDEWRPAALATSMVDDAFFILQKCSQRGLATGNLQCSSAILGQVNAVLASALRPALDARWKAACARLSQGFGAALRSDGAPAAPEDEQAASALNNIDLSARYTGALQEQLEALAGDAFPAAVDRDRILSVLADVAKTAAGLRQLAQRAVAQLCTSLLLHLRALFEEADAASYELSEAEFAANEVAFTWVDNLANLLIVMLRWFQPLLTAGNHEELVNALLEKVAEHLEACLHLKRFNQLGGLQLDRQVRQLVGGLAEASQRSVRDKFARLSQMATVLSLESAGEIAEYWGEASDFSWRFSDSQIRAILGQRVDFSLQDVAQLVL